MPDRRKKTDRQHKNRRAKPPKNRRPASSRPTGAGVESNGWTLLAHPLFLQQIEKLTVAAEAERRKEPRTPGPNAKLLAHILDLALEKQIIEKRGSWLNYRGTQLAQGRDAAKDALKNDLKLYEEIETAVKAKLDEEKD